MKGSFDSKSKGNLNHAESLIRILYMSSIENFILHFICLRFYLDEDLS